MKKINNFIIEKFKISNDISLNEVENKASKGAAIEVDLDKKFVFMLYDPNSGTISCFDTNSANDLVNDWGYEPEEARRIMSVKLGSSYMDRAGAIYTKIGQP